MWLLWCFHYFFVPIGPSRQHGMLQLVKFAEERFGGSLGKTWRVWSRMVCPWAFCLVGRAAQPVASVQSPSELATTPPHFRSEGVSFWAGEGAVQKILGEPCGILRCLPEPGCLRRYGFLHSWIRATTIPCENSQQETGTDRPDRPGPLR